VGNAGERDVIARQHAVEPIAPREAQIGEPGIWRQIINVGEKVAPDKLHPMAF
jgi:hypothetical protein